MAGNKAINKAVNKAMNKKGIVWHEVALWIIALAVLAVVVAGVFLLKGKGISLIDKIKDLLRFGR